MKLKALGPISQLPTCHRSNTVKALNETQSTGSNQPASHFTEWNSKHWVQSASFPLDSFFSSFLHPSLIARSVKNNSTLCDWLPSNYPMSNTQETVIRNSDTFGNSSDISELQTCHQKAAVASVLWWLQVCSHATDHLQVWQETAKPYTSSQCVHCRTVLETNKPANRTNSLCDSAATKVTFIDLQLH